MVLGIAFALAACFVWGWIFIIPQFMEGYTALEVAFGRYLFYGILSLFFFGRLSLRGRAKFSKEVWKTAFLYSLIFAIGYYPCIVLGLRYSTPAMCTLITGIAPITIAFYGNWREQEGTFRSLIFPSLLTFVGLLAINAPALSNRESLSQYMLGLASCFCALATWTWYVVVNRRFLNQHPDLASEDWATLNGLAMGVYGVIPLCWTSGIEHYISMRFLGGCSLLGMICSWGGMFLWSRATRYLSISLAGQLTIFETIFGLLFIYLLKREIPPLSECAGVILFITAIAYAVRVSSDKLAENGQEGERSPQSKG